MERLTAAAIAVLLLLAIAAAALHRKEGWFGGGGPEGMLEAGDYLEGYESAAERQRQETYRPRGVGRVSPHWRRGGPYWRRGGPYWLRANGPPMWAEYPYWGAPAPVGPGACRRCAACPTVDPMSTSSFCRWCWTNCHD